jgi:hypothetical protein
MVLGSGYATVRRIRPHVNMLIKLLSAVLHLEDKVYIAAEMALIPRLRQGQGLGTLALSGTLRITLLGSLLVARFRLPISLCLVLSCLSPPSPAASRRVGAPHCFTSPSIYTIYIWVSPSLVPLSSQYKPFPYSLPSPFIVYCGTMALRTGCRS